MRKGHVLKPGFIEEDFISGLETAVSKSWHPPWPLEISRVSQDAEHNLGYDGVLTSLVPFYLQFKVADYCLPQFTGALFKDRSALNLDVKKGFYRFKLHKDKKTKRYDQHNALRKLCEKNRAAYLAPLFHSAEQLTAFKKMTVERPWSYHDYFIHDSPIGRRYRIHSGRAFEKCITVQPHRDIDDKEPSHYYSYTDSSSVAFHSEPERVDGGSQTLDQFLGYVSQDVFEAERTFDFRESLLSLLPDLYGFSWQSKPFQQMARSYLADLDILPQESRVSVSDWVFEYLDVSDILLLTEAMLLEDFNIVQYIAKPLE